MSFLHYWALGYFLEAARYLGRESDVKYYTEMAEKVKAVCDEQLWDDDIGFVTRVYPGLKENGAVFSHPNPWAWAAECKLGRGDKAMKFYNALCPYYQNDMIEIRESEPYSYCQFVVGKDHTAYGRARHPFMTGSGGWSYFSATRYMLGIRPQFDSLLVDPCIPADWKGFEAERIFRGAKYQIRVENPDGVSETSLKIILVLLYYYLVKYKGWKGPVVRNICTTHRLDRMAEEFGEKCYEVPVGFKHISAKMYATDAVIGGESSGGLTVRGHIKGKDGIYAAALPTALSSRTRSPT